MIGAKRDVTDVTPCHLPLAPCHLHLAPGLTLSHKLNATLKSQLTGKRGEKRVAGHQLPGPDWHLAHHLLVYNRPAPA